MKWLILAMAFATGKSWSNQMTRVEKSATEIKECAQSLGKIANQQVAAGRLTRMAELTFAVDQLDAKIESSKKAIAHLKRDSQK